VRCKKQMSAPQSIETVTTGADKAKLAAGSRPGLLGGVTAFYLPSQAGPVAARRGGC
jgi:hypothetical protein